MTKRGLLLACALVILSSCGLFTKEKPPPPPEPTRVVIEIETAGDINPNPEGRASPLVLRIYQLKSYTVFKKSDYLSLYEKDESVLGRELINKEEVILKPNEKRTIFFEPPEDIRTVGIFAAFREYAQAQFKAATGVQQNKTNIINVFVSGTNLTIK